jgi:hypothetical protein
VVTFYVMRTVALAGLLTLFSAAAQVPQIDPQAARATNQGTLTIKVDAPPQKPSTSPIAEYVSVFSELVRAAAWPLLFGILVITQRRPLGRLLEALIELVQHSNHIKLGDMIDVEVDRSAKEAQNREVPAVEVTPNEIEAAARVGRIAESSDLSTIRARMLEFAREYEATRSNMKPSPDRTRAMNAIVAKMRTLGIAATPLLREFAHDKSSPGKRLAALAILELAPDLNYLGWIVERMSNEQPFILFHASLVLLAMVRSYGTQSRQELGTAVNRSLDVVKSFSGGPPDRNTVDILQLALTELGSTPKT